MCIRDSVSILIAVMLLLTASALAEGQTYTVGVCQLVTHDALDAACLLYTSRCV